MSLVEALIVVVALVVAGAVSIVNGSIDPVLAGIIGTAIGYAAKATIASPPAINAGTPTPWKGSD